MPGDDEPDHVNAGLVRGTSAAMIGCDAEVRRGGNILDRDGLATYAVGRHGGSRNRMAGHGDKLRAVAPTVAEPGGLRITEPPGAWRAALRKRSRR